MLTDDQVLANIVNLSFTKDRKLTSINADLIHEIDRFENINDFSKEIEIRVKKPRARRVFDS